MALALHPAEVVEEPPDFSESPLSAAEVGRNIWRLRQLHLANIGNRSRIRAIMDGGDDGIEALLGPKVKKNQELVPAANMILNAGSKLAVKIGRYPSLKVPTPLDAESQRQKEKAQLVESVLRTHDRWARLPMHMPQVGRWMPGYGFYTHVIRERLDRDGNPYPAAELRDPFDCYPGTWGVNQISRDLAIVRRVDEDTLTRSYPWLKQAMQDSAISKGRSGVGGVTATSVATGEPRWDTVMGEGIVIAEYFDERGWWLTCPEVDQLLEFVPNVAPGIPQFVVGKRFTFSALTGTFDHAMGLQAAQARLTMWGIIAMGDAVFAETNIYGDLPRGGKYNKGRDAVNVMGQGSRVEKPNQNLPYQMFQQIDRVERQLRNSVSYPVTDDAESPVGYATGSAVSELQDAISGEVHEYQVAMADALMRLDSIRLAWDEERFGGRYRKRLWKHLRTYDPRSISGIRDTDRRYGVLSGFDEPGKIVTGLQMLQGELLDHEGLAEEIEGIDDWLSIDKRNKARRVEKGLLAMMEQQGAQGDTAAIMAMIEMLPEGDTRTVLEKYFTPEGDQPSPEEQAMLEQQAAAAAGGGPGAPPGGGGGPPDVQTILSQLGIDGTVKGGSQIVGRMGGG